MTKRLMILAAALLMAGSANSQDVTPDEFLAKALSPEQWQQINVPSLTPTQRQGIYNAMLSAYQVGLNQGRTECPQAPSAPPPAASQPSSSRYAGVGGGHWVKERIDRGRMILLEDGSLWQIASFDRLNASMWFAGTNIMVIDSVACIPQYPHTLINTMDGEKACAKFIGRR